MGSVQVWRFLITFADILELWPFTLDEFVQAFHDYVSFRDIVLCVDRVLVVLCAFTCALLLPILNLLPLQFQDPRLLGEIHVALLRSIVKDIEDVARTPSMGLGANQNSSVNPGGGHPQIVEGVTSSSFCFLFLVCSVMTVFHITSPTYLLSVTGLCLGI